MKNPLRVLSTSTSSLRMEMRCCVIHTVYARYTLNVANVMAAKTGPQRRYSTWDTRPSSSSVGATENTSWKSIVWQGEKEGTRVRSRRLRAGGGGGTRTWKPRMART
jgi:hypothetical protein